MRRVCGVLLVCCALVAALAPAAHATVKPTALIYGDSLVWESQTVFLHQAALHHATVVFHGGPGTEPCDWLQTLDDDLATYKPAVVVIATAGNSFFSCMNDPATGEPYPMGSDGYYARYRADIDSFFAKVTAFGGKMVFAEDPPMAGVVRDTAVSQIIAMATELAGQYRGVSLAKNTRSTLAVKKKFASYKTCLKSETAAEGCENGLIAIRTVSGDPSQIGLHLCPEGIDFPDGCATYSSGELRFGKALYGVSQHPPKPVLA